MVDAKPYPTKEFKNGERNVDTWLPHIAFSLTNLRYFLE